MAYLESKARAFYERYGRIVRDRAVILLRDSDAANDVLQEIFLQLVTSDAHILDEPAPTGWLHRVTTNHCLNKLRDDRRRRELLMERHREHNSGEIAAPLIEAEARALVREILSRLPEQIQDIVVYRFVDEMTHDEIAARAGLSPRTIGNRLMAFGNNWRSIHAGRRR